MCQFRSRLEHEETVLEEVLQYLDYIIELLSRRIVEKQEENNEQGRQNYSL